MNLYPKLYLPRVQDITYEMLQDYHIQALLLDVDNTIMDYYRRIPEGLPKWCEELKEKGILFCIVSNSNHKEKVKHLGELLQIPYIYFAKKPFKSGFQKAVKILDLPKEKIAMVGDQIFTDILGANRMGMMPILVDPILEKDILVTVIKRPIENYIKRRYYQRREKAKDVFK